MRQTKLGIFTSSSIGLGCMNIAMGYGPRPSEAESEKLLNEALDCGYRFLDTAAIYGMGYSEQLIGKFLVHRRHEYILASKCGIFRNAEGETETNGRPEIIRQSCEDSLRRLNTDVIDLYYLHRIDKNVAVEESVGELSRLIEQGKIRSIGLSEVCSDSLLRAHNTHPITALQSEYSLWSRTPERKILATCRELGVSLVAFSPLGRQFLTGKSQDATHADKNNFRATIARPRFEPGNFAKNSLLLKPYGEIAKEKGMSMAQLALAWVLAKGRENGQRMTGSDDKGGDIIPIPGTSNRHHLRENALADNFTLAQSTIDKLDSLINEETVAGDRYTKELMQSVDSERD